MRKKILFYCPSQKDLAEELFLANPEIIVGQIDWLKFGDGFPNLKIFNSTELADTDVSFLADFSRVEEMFPQLAVIYALPSYGINSLKVFLPFFSTGTMDRVAEDGQIVTAKTLARLLSVIPPAACAPQVIIFDIHALQEQFYFSDQVRVHCVTAINLLLARLKSEGKTAANTAIAFPDEGAYKRFKRYFEGFSLIICEKRRIGSKRVVTIKEGDPKGKDVIIVDDLILTGGTLLECAKVLFAAGALSVGAYATHPVFPKKNWSDFAEDGIRLYLTNSCPEIVAQISNDFLLQEPEIISLAPVIIDIIDNH